MYDVMSDEDRVHFRLQFFAFVFSLRRYMRVQENVMVGRYRSTDPG